MCDSNNLYYRPQPHEFVVIRADGTRVHKGDEFHRRDIVWNFVSCTHPRKIFVESIEDPNEDPIWPNRTSQEFYPSVFDLGIWDGTDGKWTFEPEWPHDDIAPGYDIKPLFDKLFNSDKEPKTYGTDTTDNKDENDHMLKTPIPVGGDKTYTTDTERNKEFWANSDETDMWARIDQSYQRVTKCDGTVILTPRAKSDKSDEEPVFYTNGVPQYESDKPWVTPGPSESEIAAQADRVRRADIWVETGVWTKSDKRETYTHEDAMRDLHEAEESDIADDDDKAELVREADEQRELLEAFNKSDLHESEETDKADGN